MRLKSARCAFDSRGRHQLWPYSSDLRRLTVNESHVGLNPTGHPKSISVSQAVSQVA